jgi:HEAT repeat protein
VAPEKEDEQAAVELMGALGLREAIPDLERRAWGLRRFVSDTCPFHAKIALARFGNPRARAELLKELDATRPDVLAAAVVAVGRAKIQEARPKLEKLTTAAVDPELVREALARLEDGERDGDADG